MTTQGGDGDLSEMAITTSMFPVPSPMSMLQRGAPSPVPTPPMLQRGAPAPVPMSASTTLRIFPVSMRSLTGLYPTHALKISQPWIGMILDGVKSWELRSRPTDMRGHVALYQTAAMQIVELRPWLIALSFVP